MEPDPRIATIALVLCSFVVAGVSLPEPAAPTKAPSDGALRVGFYEKTCPKAETIIQDVIKQAVAQNPGLPAGFVRLHFHDCFVRGCDGSVLLNKTANGEPTEMTSKGNLGLRGFEIIETAKTRLEAECPNTVSCADIVAFAARDASVLAKFPHYDVPGGRRDGTVSLATDAQGNLPIPFTRDVPQLTEVFQKKGLNTLDMVTLLGAHSIGRLHCAVLLIQVKSDKGDPTKLVWNSTDLGVDPMYADHLKMLCPSKTDEEATVSLNPSPPPLNNELSNKFYTNVVDQRAALMSDQALMFDPETKKMVLEMAKDPKLWQDRFRASMVKMGMIDVLTGTQGEIRKSCGVANPA